MKQILTKNKQHETKAIGFIDGVIKESNLSYSQLMCHLENKKDYWKNESLALYFINLFDMTSEQYDRKNYLSALILYAEKLLIKFRLNNLSQFKTN